MTAQLRRYNLGTRAEGTKTRGASEGGSVLPLLALAMVVFCLVLVALRGLVISEVRRAEAQTVADLVALAAAGAAPSNAEEAAQSVAECNDSNVISLQRVKDGIQVTISHNQVSAVATATWVELPG